MKAIYQSGDLYIIQISEKKYYCGDGIRNNIGESAAQFLRFNPYMIDVSEKAIEIPKEIVDFIEKTTKST